MGIDRVWLFVPNIIYIRVSTVAMILLIAIVVGLRTRRASIVGLTILGWMGVYEVVWQLLYAGFGYQPFRPAIQFSCAVFGWLILGYYMGIRPDRYLTAAWALITVAWIALGFHANFPTHPFSVSDEIINELSKTILGVAYLLGALRTVARRQPASISPSLTPVTEQPPVEPAGPLSVAPGVS
jgi:hypothetical protein